MTVHGSSLGIVRHTARGRTGHTGCEGTDWESETSLRCMVAHGTTATRRITMSTGQKTASFSQGWSFDIATLSRMRIINRAGTGLSSITVHGAGMGRTRLTVRARQGITVCEGTDWESETSVRCRVALGEQGTRRIVLTAGSRAGSISQAWSVDMDVVSRLRISNRAGTGSVSVTVHGAGLGIVRQTARGRTGHTGCEGTDWESETSVRCRLSLGSFGTRRVVMTVGSQRGSISQAWSADVDAVSLSRNGNRAGIGSISMTVHGTGMSLARLTSSARLSRTGCEATEWVSETSMRCRVGYGSQGTRQVVMTVGQRSGSVSQAWSVDVDAISRTRRANRAGTGSASVTVHGAGMGIVRLTATGRTGPTGSEATSWESETSMRCSVGHGSGLSWRMVMTVGSRGGSTSQAWSADGGCLLYTSPSPRDRQKSRMPSSA